MVYTYDIAICGTSGATGLFVSADTVNPEDFTGTVIKISLSGISDNTCYEVLSPCECNQTDGLLIIDSYINCWDCVSSIPRSANTESFICVVCNSISGETVTSVSAPHPVWTDSQGTAVTQLNAITLGGMNGLNN